MRRANIFIGHPPAPDLHPVAVSAEFHYSPPLERICPVCHTKFVGTRCPINGGHGREPLR